MWRGGEEQCIGMGGMEDRMRSHDEGQERRGGERTGVREQ